MREKKHENERKKANERKPPFTFYCILSLLSSLLSLLVFVSFFYDDSDDMRMDFVCFMDSPKPVSNSVWFTFETKPDTLICLVI